MKKICLFFLLLFIPMVVSASTVNYDITDFLIDAKILNNGDMEVQELIVLDGNFNGYLRELQYSNPKLTEYNQGEINFANSAIYNATGIENVTVSTKKVEGEEISFKTFNEIFIPLKKTTNEKYATNGNYVFWQEDNILNYKMYQKAEDEVIAFLISYTVSDAVVIHEDVAELYWNFIGSNFTDKIYNLKIKVQLPEEDNSEKFRYWAHGDITGEIKALNNRTLFAEMKSLEKNTIIDIRTTFNKELISDRTSLRFSKENALEKILEVETKRAEEVNKQREFIRFMYNFVQALTKVFYLINLIIWIWIYMKYDKEYKSNFNAQYYREFTGNYNVEVIDYLMKKTITPNALSASIMNLIYKKNIEVEEIIGNNKKKKYKFHFKNNNQVTDTEQLLLDFLFERVGKDNTFTTMDLEKYAKSPKTCNKFSRNYNDWKNCVIKDAEQEKFYENNGIPIVIGILTLLISILIFLIVMYYQIDYIPCYFLLPFSIIFLFYTILIKKRTKKGNEDYLRWKAFKNFLNDFGNFNVKELPEITLWEKYLVYACIFGLADKVQKSMNVKINEMEDMSFTPSLSWHPFFNWQLYHIVNESVNTSIKNNIAATSVNANSKNSSGSGFGGGFSGGSGFGGGGGGGHGF